MSFCTNLRFVAKEQVNPVSTNRPLRRKRADLYDCVLFSMNGCVLLFFSFFPHIFHSLFPFSKSTVGYPALVASTDRIFFASFIFYLSPTSALLADSDKGPPSG